ncbi:MAG: alpha/beta fold hydrolase [Candidatus Thiodiazotropha sp. 6PLUC9]
MTYSLNLCVAALLFATACSSPSERFDQQASTLGLHKQKLEGDGFTHTIYKNSPADDSSELHVYFGGDGTPWIDGKVIAWDPTPRNPVGLRLMALDDTPSIYLGRPCYHGSSGSSACSPILWTYERYSRTVTESMASVLQKIVEQGKYRDLVLIGFSGGGGIAMFLAAEFPQTRQVVTLAGNLDIEAWTHLHDYDKLIGSENPKSMPPLPEEIQQYHLAGGKDENIPPWMIEAAVQAQSNSQFITVEEFTHGCCWEKIWKRMLNCLHDACEWNKQGRIIAIED